MNTVKNLVKNEPVVSAAVITGLVGALLRLLISFGIDITPDQVEEITEPRESSRATAAWPLAAASTVTPRSARETSCSSSPAVTLTVTDSARSETRAAISSGVWPATSCPRIVVPGRARPSNCFAYARAPPPRTTAITAMIASRMKTSRLRPPRRADGPPSAAGSLTFVMILVPFSTAVVSSLAWSARGHRGPSPAPP